MRASADGRKDDWDGHLPLAMFAINNVMSSLGRDLTPGPLFIDRCTHPQLPLSPPHDDLSACESPAPYEQRMWAMEVTVQELLAAAQAEWKAKLNAVPR